MIKQTILWTVLPKSVEQASPGKHLNFSVFISPRLEAPDVASPKLGLFQAFKDWPATVKSLKDKFQLHLDGLASPLPAELLSEALLDSELWQEIFTDNATVESYTFDDLSQYEIHSYPVQQILAYVKERYQKAAVRSATELPSIDNFLGTVGDLKEFGFKDIKDLDTPTNHQKPLLENVLKENKAVDAKDPKVKQYGPAFSFYQVKDFYAQQDFIEPLVKPELDFHQALSALGDYPEILRRLGLVLDMRVTLAAGIPANLASSAIQLAPQWQEANLKNVSPKTKCFIADTAFMAAPRDGKEINEGFLKLSDFETFSLVQVDPDGIALKAMNFVDSLKGEQALLQNEGAPDQAGLPTMRSSGIALIHTGSAISLVKTLEQSKEQNDSVIAAIASSTSSTVTPDEILHAEDLIAGYRFDVWDSQADKWFSLCYRDGIFGFPAPATKKVELINDPNNPQFEGFVTTAAVERADKDNNGKPALNLHEAILTWTGWSACVPRPGRSLQFEPNVNNDPNHVAERPRLYENKAETEFKLETNFTVTKGTLPRLRFGHDYRLRVRLVDLAGNSHDLSHPNISEQTREALSYERFEPVSPPVLVLRRALLDKSKNPPVPFDHGWGESLERLVIRSNYDDVIPKEFTQRHVAPPQTSQLMAETHGMFDALSANGKDRQLDRNAYLDLIKLEGKLAEVHAEGQLNVPYLPDPCAVGAAFLGLPGVQSSVAKTYPFRLENNKPWFEREPFRLVLINSDYAFNDPSEEAPEFFESHPIFGKRVLLVKLKQAEVRKVRMSCYPSEAHDSPEPAALADFGIWQWIEEVYEKNLLTPPPAQTRAELLKLAKQGQHWMITPYREITLVHAVRQPLLEPSFFDLNPKKQQIGRTYAELFGKIKNIHGKSMIKIDVVAKWHEEVDYLEEQPRKTKSITGQAHVLEKQVQPITSDIVLDKLLNKSDGSGQEPVRHEFGDTKYREVTYTAVATTRFREYFPSESQAKFTRESKEVTVKVLNSARPAAPKVLYIIPIFGWEGRSSSGDPTQITSIRGGHGLRVYLDRPWFSSGNDERLGVVLSGEHTVPDNLKQHVTMWGQDPIWHTAMPATSAQFGHSPAPQDFLLATEIRGGLSLDEVSTQKFAVAGHKVEYDDERDLWYCDIQIKTTDSYFPFIRMALARFQPNSIIDAHLSRVIVADFAQLAADRSATVKIFKGERIKLEIAVTGDSPFYFESTGKTIPNFVTAHVEQQQAGYVGELAWQEVSDTQVELEPPVKLIQPIIWQGEINLPASLFAGPPLRLAIREYERFQSDTGSKLRLVYADAIPLHFQQLLN